MNRLSKILGWYVDLICLGGPFLVIAIAAGVTILLQRVFGI